MMLRTGKDTERELSYAPSKSVNWCSYSENYLEVPTKAKHVYILSPGNSNLRYSSEVSTYVSQKAVSKSIHGRTMWNSPNWKWPNNHQQYICKLYNCSLGWIPYGNDEDKTIATCNMIKLPTCWAKETNKKRIHEFISMKFKERQN